MPFTTPPTWSVGEIGTSTDLNILNADISYLYNGMPACGLLHSASVAVANTTPVPIGFDTEGFDTDAMHDNTNSARITINTAGYYLLEAGVRWESNATGGRFIHIKRTSGVTTTYIASEGGLAANGLQTYTSVSALTRAAVGDFYFVEVYQNSGVSLNIQVEDETSPRFAAIMLRGL